jgi:phosphate acetyltransferase
MKLNSLYISPLELESGSSTISFGMMKILKRKYKKVAFFRPIIKRVPNRVIDLIVDFYNLELSKDDCIGMSVEQAEEYISNGEINSLYEILIKKYEKLQKENDFVLIQGVSMDVLSSTIDFDINLQIAKNLDTAIIGVLTGSGKTDKQIKEDIKIEHNRIEKNKCNHFATFVNRIDSEKIDKLSMQNLNENYQLYFLPEVKEISSITIEDVKKSLDAKLLFGEEDDLVKLVNDVKIAAMSFEHYIDYIRDNDLIIVPSDRSDIIIGSIAAVHSKTVPSISGILLTGNIKLKKQIKELIGGFKHHIPILRVKDDTYTVAKQVSNIKSVLKASNNTKTSLISGLFNTHVDISKIEDKLEEQSGNIVTPIMFEYSLLKKAREDKKTIVLPESMDERILKASEVLLNLGVVDIILIGLKDKIERKASLKGVDISKATIIDPLNYEKTDLMIKEFYALRKHKGITNDCASDFIKNNYNYFATMLVHLGIADGMVSGSVSTTANTVRPALQIVKTKPGINIVSSVFLMCMETEVLVFGDCAINPDPNAQELSEIAISSSETARSFGIEPKVAMLSYSTGESGSGVDVDKVKEATKIAKKNSDILIEGPIQFDAAIDKNVAKKKLPDSKVAGEATVFIFPDLNTGNNTYKAVQRSSGAVAIGPILQGLNKPINDLSRGCTIPDIINTVAITAIQAKKDKK